MASDLFPWCQRAWSVVFELVANQAKQIVPISNESIKKIEIALPDPVSFCAEEGTDCDELEGSDWLLTRAFS